MSNPRPNPVSRRTVLRKTAITGAALVGATAASGSALAADIEPYDTVEVTASSAMTFSDCCTASLSCAAARRSRGDRGTAVEACDLNASRTLVRVVWFGSSGNQHTVSYVDADDLGSV